MNEQGREPPIEYMQRTCAYYQALQFGDPYRWAQHDNVPFTPFLKPLAEASIALVLYFINQSI